MKRIMEETMEDKLTVKDNIDYIYHHNGDLEEVSPENGRDYSLREMQKIVGGHIEIVRPPFGNKIMVVNDSGLLERLPYNEKATQWLHYNGCINPYIVGDVLICDSAKVL